MKAWILGILLVLVGLVLVIGLWLLGYHLTGKHAFTAWKAERVAMGDRVDWKDLIPPPVPADQNFAEAPLVRGSMVEKGQVDPRFGSAGIPKDVAAVLGDWREGRRDDLAAAAKAYGKPSLDVALKPLDSVLTELEEASRRPACRLRIAYEEGEIPALLGFRSALRTLRVRSLNHLRSGRQDLALQDLQTCLRIAEHLKREPHLISALLRTAILNISMQVVWEGVEDRLWDARHLVAIQAELAKINLLDMLQRAWRAERQGMIESMSAAAENRPGPKFWEDPKAKKVRLGPLGRGWFYRNLLESCRHMTHLVDLQDPNARRIYPSREIDPLSLEKGLRFRFDLVMARIAIPALHGQTRRVGQLQAMVDQGVVACALERHRIERGDFPDRLEALAPVYLKALPHDLVTGGPLHYARQGPTYTLYQVGWDGKDEGGGLGWVGDGKERKLDPAKGDWVWPHPEH